MRHTHEQLAELLSLYQRPIYDAIHFGCTEAAQATRFRALAPDRKQLFSGMVRARAYDYLRTNPIDGATLNRRAHRNMQSVTLTDDASGLELRLIRLRTFQPACTQLIIPRMDEDPVLAPVLSRCTLELSEPGLVGIAWETPAFDTDGYPAEDIPLTAIRTQPGTKLRDGKADFVLRLEGKSQVIPEAAFDPNETEMTFTMDDETGDQ